MKPLLEVSGALRVEYRIRLAPHTGESAFLIRDERRIVGGTGGWGALAGARMGAMVRLGGWVGDDSHGRYLLAELGAAGVELAVEVRAGAATPYAILIRAPDGTVQTLLSPEAAEGGAAQTETQLSESLAQTLGTAFEAGEVARQLRAFEASFGDLAVFEEV